VADSPAVAAARATLAAGLICTPFLWPLGGRHAPEGHARITVLPAENLRVHLAGMVLVSPPGDLRGLTPRELEVPGLLIEGWSNAGIAPALVVAPLPQASAASGKWFRKSSKVRTFGRRAATGVGALSHRSPCRRAQPDLA
jgi:hypothetical protein